MSGGPTIIHMDSFTAGQTTSVPETVAQVRQISDMLRCEALPRGASRELITKVPGRPQPATAIWMILTMTRIIAITM